MIILNYRLKIIYLLFFYLIVNISLFAQVNQYPHANMTQFVRYSGNMYEPPANRSFAYTGDTSMCGFTYSKYCFMASYNNGVYNCGNYIHTSFYTRMSGTKMYMLTGDCANISNELLLYDWGLNIGDTMNVCPQTLNNGLAIADSVYILTMHDGQQRKYIRLHGISLSNPNYIYRWIEGIGDIDRGFLAELDFEGGVDIFVCHSENNIEVWNNPTMTAFCATPFNSINANFSADTVCFNDTTCFKDLSISNNGPINSWLWDFGDGTTDTVKNPCHIYSSANSHTASLIVTNVSGEKDTITNTIIVNGLPQLTCLASPDTIAPGDATQLSFSTPSGSSISSYVWMGPQMTCTGCPDPFAFPVSSTCYTIIGIDSNSCYNACYACIEVFNPTATSEYSEMDMFHFFPNPNNGKFKIVNKEINGQNISIFIMNILGNIIYQTTSVSKSIEIDLSKESKGIYFITVQSKNFVQNQKVIIE